MKHRCLSVNIYTVPLLNAPLYIQDLSLRYPFLKHPKVRHYINALAVCTHQVYHNLQLFWNEIHGMG